MINSKFYFAHVYNAIPSDIFNFSPKIFLVCILNPQHMSMKVIKDNSEWGVKRLQVYILINLYVRKAVWQR